MLCWRVGRWSVEPAPIVDRLRRFEIRAPPSELLASALRTLCYESTRVRAEPLSECHFCRMPWADWTDWLLSHAIGPGDRPRRTQMRGFGNLAAPTSRSAA